MRHLLALLALTGALAAAAPAPARDITLNKTAAEALKSICDKIGGKFSQGARHYGCGTDCHGGPGTDCIVSCAPGEKCIAQVIGGRRPRSVEDALRQPERHAR